MWFIPTKYADGSDYSFFISSILTSGMSAESAKFFIKASYYTGSDPIGNIPYPAAGVYFITGKPDDIQWDKGNSANTSETGDIYLVSYAGGKTDILTIASGVRLSEGKYRWSIPSYLPEYGADRFAISIRGKAWSKESEKFSIFSKGDVDKIGGPTCEDRKIISIIAAGGSAGAAYADQDGSQFGVRADVNLDGILSSSDVTAFDALYLSLGCANLSSSDLDATSKNSGFFGNVMDAFKNFFGGSGR